MPKVDNLIDGLISKLGDVSPKWTSTFPPDPSGYKKLNKLITRYGQPAVKEALQYALEEKIVPINDSAMPVLVGLVRVRTGQKPEPSETATRRRWKQIARAALDQEEAHD